MVRIPTGYTAKLYDGEQEFEDFVRQAARGMGAFYHLRDADWNTPLTYPEPQAPRAKEELRDALREHSAWRRADEHERYRLWSEYVAQQEAYAARRNEEAEFLARRDRFDAMIAKVQAKDVPPKLETFKKFMLDQLATEFQHSREPYKPMTLTYSEWCDHETEWLERKEKLARERFREATKRDKEIREYVDLLGETFGFKVEKG